MGRGAGTSLSWGCCPQHLPLAPGPRGARLGQHLPPAPSPRVPASTWGAFQGEVTPELALPACPSQPHRSAPCSLSPAAPGLLWPSGTPHTPKAGISSVAQPRWWCRAEAAAGSALGALSAGASCLAAGPAGASRPRHTRPMVLTSPSVRQPLGAGTSLPTPAWTLGLFCSPALVLPLSAEDLL